MSVLSQYVRNIAVFLIFISFLGLVLPVEKYKSYISMVTGLVLVMIILVPVGRLIGDPKLQLSNIVSHMEIELNRAIIDKEMDYYEQERLDMVVGAYKSSLENQLEGLMWAKGYETVNCNFSIDEGEGSFGAIQAIALEVFPVSPGNASKSSLISIEKISIGPSITSREMGTDKEDNKEDEEIKNLKNYLSDFYNLSVDNIYIIVREN